MAASNKLRVTPSHSMQPTTSLHQWIVHTPTYGRSVSSKPAGFGSYERPKSPLVRARIECSAAVNTLWEWVGAYQTAPGS